MQILFKPVYTRVKTKRLNTQWFWVRAHSQSKETYICKNIFFVYFSNDNKWCMNEKFSSANDYNIKYKLIYFCLLRHLFTLKALIVYIIIKLFLGSVHLQIIIFITTLPRRIQNADVFVLNYGCPATKGTRLQRKLKRKWMIGLTLFKQRLRKIKIKKPNNLMKSWIKVKIILILL